MKNEVAEKIITEFVALSPKSYAYKYCETEVKTAKGVSLSVSEKTMDFNDYKRVLDSNNSQTRKILEYEVLTSKFSPMLKTRLF